MHAVIDSTLHSFDLFIVLQVYNNVIMTYSIKLRILYLNVSLKLIHSLFYDLAFATPTNAGLKTRVLSVYPT